MIAQHGAEGAGITKAVSNRQLRVARAVIGSVVWLAAFVYFAPEWTVALIWLGALVHVPLAMALVDVRDHAAGTAATRGRLQLPSAILLVVAFEMPALAVLFAAPWLIFLAWAGGAGVARLIKRGVWRAGAFADIGLMFLPVHGFWLAATLIGWDAFGFPPVIVALTVAHMLYAGFVLNVIAARIVAARPAPVPVAAGLCMNVGYLAVAGAITASYLHGYTRLEFPAVCLYGGSVIVLGWMQLFVALRPKSGLPWLSRVLLVVSDLSLGTAVTLAFIFAWGVHRGVPTLTIPQMITWHGTLNVFGFGLCGLIGWLLANPRVNRG